jgi:sialic acid synthase SpsE
MPFYKIASADINNIPFLRKIGKKGKPVVLSTGASNKDEIILAIKTLETSGSSEISLLHCILNYPTPDLQAHLGMIKGLIESFPDYLIGYSDHTLPDEAMVSLCTAYTLGAVILEKHFTHDKALPGNDHYHAMDVFDLKKFVQLSEKVHTLLGPIKEKGPVATEEISRQNARRSIVIKSDLSAGHKLTEGDITYKRPGTGISPTHWDEVIGMKLLTALKSDHVIQWSDIK